MEKRKLIAFYHRPLGSQLDHCDSACLTGSVRNARLRKYPHSKYFIQF